MVISQAEFRHTPLAFSVTTYVSKQDMKDLDQMGGLRKAAAHGNFEKLDPGRAALMEQQVNLFLARLRGLMGDV